MEMGVEPLIPGVQDSDKSGLAAEIVASESEECLGGGIEQNVQEGPFIGKYKGIEFMRKGKNDMEIAHGQELRLASLQPSGFIEPLALWAMAVAAGIVSRPFEAANVALLKMAAERGSATALDGTHDFKLINRQRMGAAEGLAMEAQDIRHFPAGSLQPRQPCRPMTMGRRHGSALPELSGIGDRQQIQRALGGPESFARNLQISHG